MSYFFTSESVSQGHPDKVADQISDAIVDNFIARDPNSHCAIETIVTTGQVLVAGEVKSEAYVDIPEVVRKTINDIGYTNSDYRFDGNSCGVLNAIHEQSADIDQGVSRDTKEEQGAGDQGIMFGYATNETDNYMPATLDIAHRIVKELAIIREEEPMLMPYLRPDAKSQVTIEYSDDNIPMRITDIVVSTQHDEFDEDEVMLAKIREDVINIVIPRVKNSYSEKIQKLFNDDIKYFVNPTGKFVIGGPHGDTGLTGRKIIVDTYGGWGAHGGGAFCVDGETEYLSDDLLWHKISEYKGGKVAQWTSLYGDIEFVEPSAYHVNPAKKMFRFTTDETDQVLSLDHNIVVEDEENNIYKVSVKEVLEDGLVDKIPGAFTLPTTHNESDEDREVFDQDELFKKIFNHDYETLYKEFKDASWSKLMSVGIILNQLAESRNSDVALVTEDKDEADFVQVVMANFSDRAVHVEKEYDTYKVVMKDNWKIDFDKLEEVHQYHLAEDENMYCFTVPSGMLLLRRSGKYFVTGNCGKDVSKVDRSAAYMARYLAKNAVAAGIADRMLIQFAYAIGVAEPISLFVNTYGTSHVDMTAGEIAKKIKSMFDLRPYAIEQKLKLRNPIYLETASYGHMGQEPCVVTKNFDSHYDHVEKTVELFTWEKFDDVDYFKKEFSL